MALRAICNQCSEWYFFLGKTCSLTFEICVRSFGTSFAQAFSAVVPSGGSSEVMVFSAVRHEYNQICGRMIFLRK